MSGPLNEQNMDSLCAALCYAMGIEPPEHAAAPNKALCDYVDRALGGKKADRIVMYNPDAVAQWIQEKYPLYLWEVKQRAELELPLRAVMPSVTPVCFGTMYTGAQPEVHGIQEYAKPVIRIDTIFDALIRAGKKPVIIAENECSMGKIFLERDMDYFLFDVDEEVNAKAAEILLEDKYDFVIVYNGNYDYVMHRYGPEDPYSLAALRIDSHEFGQIASIIGTHWTHHNTLLGFGMDHGCHEIDGHLGSHGLDMPEDLNVKHWYQAFPAKG